MSSVWFCVVLNKNFCARGVQEVSLEIARMAGEAFVDFRMEEDGFDGDCYSFLKCELEAGDFMEGLRRSPGVVTVLDSYDNPSYLSEEEVYAFTEVKEKPPLFARYGDTVAVGGEGPFCGLKGVVVTPGVEKSRVIFRFHTVTRKEWVKNDEIVLIGNVFFHLKVPVENNRFSEYRERKCPVLKEKSKRVNTGKRRRTSN